LKRIVLWIVAGILLVLALVVLGAVLFAIRFEVDDYRAQVEQVLSDVIAFDVRFGEPLHLTFDRSEGGWSWLPVFEARAISVHPRGDRWKSPIGQLDHLIVSFEPWAAAFEGRLVLRHVRTRGGHLSMHRDAEGVGNWSREPNEELVPEVADAPKNEDAGFVLGLAVFEDLSIAFRSDVSGASFDVIISELEVVNEGGGPRMNLTGEGFFEELPFRVSTTLQSPSGEGRPFWSTPGDFDLDFDAHWGETKLGLEGRVTDPRGAPHSQLQFSAAVPDLAARLRLLSFDPGIDLAGLRPVAVTGRIEGGDGEIRVVALQSSLETEAGDRLTVVGTLGDVITQSGLDLTLAVETGDLTALARRAELELPSLTSMTGQARVFGEWARPELRDVNAQLEHVSGARLAVLGRARLDPKTQSGDLRARIDVDTVAAALATIDDVLAWRGEPPLLDPPAMDWLEGHPAASGFGPLALDARLIGSRKKGRLEQVVFRAGQQGADWLEAAGRVEALWPAPARAELEVTVGSEDLENVLGALGMVDPPKLWRVRGNGVLSGDIGSLGLRQLQIVARRGTQASIGIGGDVPLLRHIPGTELDVAVSAVDGASLGGLFGWVFPATERIEMNAKVVGSEDRFATRDLALRIGESRIRGSGELIWRGPARRPRLTASLEADLLRMVDLGIHPDRIGGEDEGPSPTARVAEAWDSPIPFGRLGTADVKLDVEVAVLAGREGWTATDIGLQMTLDDGVLAGDGLSMSLGGGLGGRIRVTPGANANLSPPGVTLDITGVRLDLARGIAQFRRDKVVTGLAQMKVGLGSQGQTARELVAALKGDLFFYLGEGSASTKYSHALQVDYAKRFDPTAEIQDFERVGCLIADAQVKRGVISFATVFLDTEDKQILGSGSIDLNDATLLVGLTPALKETIPGSVAAAIRISGPISDPNIIVEPFATASSVTQGLIERALRPARRYVPIFSTISEGAGRATTSIVRGFGVEVPDTLWRPGVDLTCARMLEIDRIQRSLAPGTGSPTQGSP
jgi:uncharacterized protein involved in outer membrane biogenesis